MRKLKDYLMISVKGACMGAADVIPGVSGGTIAFIMGIYDEFVGSIARVDSEAVKLLFKGRFRDFWKHINGWFLLSIVAGIGVSVVALAGLMQMLLSGHPIQTWAFFFGLIVASSIFILKGISGWKLREVLFVIMGVVLGVVVCTLSPTQTPDGLWFIFISGAIAICAMILPGISGSFILLILGKYEYIMGVISGLFSGEFWSNFLILCVFVFFFVQKSLTALLHTSASRDRAVILGGMTSLVGVLIFGVVRSFLSFPRVLFTLMLVVALTSAYENIIFDESDVLTAESVGSPTEEDRIYRKV